MVKTRAQAKNMGSSTSAASSKSNSSVVAQRAAFEAQHARCMAEMELNQIQAEREERERTMAVEREERERAAAVEREERERAAAVERENRERAAAAECAAADAELRAQIAALEVRSHTSRAASRTSAQHVENWIKNFNVIFLDNPVGTGFSYVDDLRLLTTTNDQIALDFVNLMRGFYEKHPEFESVPFYIYGQSYGGKMAVDMAIRMVEAQRDNTIRSDFRGFAMGNAWISPVDATLTWAPLLLAAGLVDDAGHDAILAGAREAERLFNAGMYVQSTNQWRQTQWTVFQRTTNVDFYNILTKMPVSGTRTRKTPYELSRDMLIHNIPYMSDNTREVVDLNTLMNTQVKNALHIPDHVIWGQQSNAVFNTLSEDFMKPVTDGIEKILNETELIVTKYNGNLDLICDTPGQILWVDRLKWEGAEAYKNATRHPIWVDNKLEGYYKAQGNFRFFWINYAGHSVPVDNPAGTSAFLRDMTSFG